MSEDNAEVEYVVTRLLVEGEPDPAWYTQFLPTSGRDAATCWMHLCLHLEDDYGFSPEEGFTFKRMVTAQDLLNIYYVYDHFPDDCTDKHGIKGWIEKMHRPRNLCDEVSIDLSSYLNCH